MNEVSPSSPRIYDSLPKEIELSENLPYHPRDKRLIWDAELIQMKLERETAFADEAMDKQIHYVAIKNSIAGVDFLNACKASSPKHKDIEVDNVTFANGRKVEIAWCQNPLSREEMEDEHLAVFGKVQLLSGQEVEFELYAVFDGHCGRGSATYAKDHLQRHFEKELAEMNPSRLTDPGIWNALKATFVHLDQEMKQLANDGSGCTAVVCVKIGNALWTANVGDTRAILKRGDRVVALSSDAKPTRPKTKPEKEWKIAGQAEDVNRFVTSILKRGGVILNNRVNGDLSTARALNDGWFRSYPSLDGLFERDQFYVMVCRPKITKHGIPQNTPVFLVLACDGLWDVASSQDVGSALCESSNAISLVKGALSATEVRDKRPYPKCRDNITVMVVDFSPVVAANNS